MPLCAAKNTPDTLNCGASFASTTAPFSQNSSVLVQVASGKAQLGHLKPPGWFIDRSARDRLVTTLCSISTFAVAAAAPQSPDRKSVVSGKSVSVRVDLGGRRDITKKTDKRTHRT